MGYHDYVCRQRYPHDGDNDDDEDDVADASMWYYIQYTRRRAVRQTR